MEQHEFKQRIDAVKLRAQGHWHGILTQLLHESKLVNRKNQACPKCQGGKDRFQYTDKFGHGDAHCRMCGHIDGFELLQCGNGWTFSDALKAVEGLVGDVTKLVPQPQPDVKDKTAKMVRLANRIWREAKAISAGDPVDCYLRARGLGMEQYPPSLRTHASLGYYEREEGERKAELVRNIPAMVALLQDREKKVVTVHRTYVEDGAKARVPDAKKCLSVFEVGPAIRLFEPTDELALTEGIETALAIHLRLNKPVWATYSASNMEHVAVPDTVKRVCIYADNDASFTGQAAAYTLARRLKSKDKAREVRVFVPTRVGTDWADVWLAHVHRQQKRAA